MAARSPRRSISEVKPSMSLNMMVTVPPGAAVVHSASPASARPSTTSSIMRGAGGGSRKAGVSGKLGTAGGPNGGPPRCAV